jgi:hypothetical protein
MPFYEALTVWVMANWPDQMLDRVDTMVRTAIGAARYVREGEWSTSRLVAVVGKAGRRPTDREVRQHMGSAVRLVSYDATGFEFADESRQAPPASSLGWALVADLKLALGDHAYMVTPSAAALLDHYSDIAVDHLNSIQTKSVTVEAPGGLSGLALFAAARPTKRSNRSNRITEVLRDLPQPSSVALSHLLLGTDHHPEASLLWRHLMGFSPAEAPASVVADWRAELPALCPAILAFSERRRRRTRDRSRNGDNLRQVFEGVVGDDLDRGQPAIAM